MLVFILFISHLVGDFFLQSSEMAEAKKDSLKQLLKHSIIYGAVFVVPVFVFLKPLYAFLTLSIIGTSHFIVDLLRIKIDRRWNEPSVQFITFLIDQSLHLSIILMVYFGGDLNFNTNELYSNCLKFSCFSHMVLYILLFVILLVPASVLIKKIFLIVCKEDKIESKKRPQTTNEEASNNMSAGSLIGMLERIITAILLLCNQYGAIGLVLTAKSIARFKKMEEDRDFAEKYLIGTLLSLTITLIVTLLIKHIIAYI